MRSTLRTLTVLALALITALAVAACGGNDNSSSSGGGSDNGGGTAAGKTGGEANTDLTSYPDYMDPALSYTQEGWQTLWTVYTGLLTYKHEEGAGGAELIPGLAEAMPQVSNGGKTYKLKLRDGLKFSDGTPVKASDFEHTIQRVLNLESGGSAFYLEIEGAEKYVKDGKAKADIPGIITNDQTGEITINITKPDGAFPYVLAMDFAGIVPSSTPFENMSKNPPAGVGPFKLENVRQNRGFTMVKNPSFPEIDGVPQAKLDRINVEVVKNQARQTQDIINNKVDYALDPPPADQLRTVKTQYKDRYEEFVTNSTYYYFLNVKVAPFNKKEAREALNYAIDKRALARLFGGLFEPDCNFLPPGMQGYEKIDPCPWGDPNAAPDVAKAKQIVKDAGLTGTKVEVWGDDEDPSTPVTNYLADVLNQIGFKAEPKIVEGSVYFQTIGNQKTKAQVGFANWFQDFPHPKNFMFLVDPASIQPTNNQNFGNVDDPKIRQMLADANAKPIEESASEYAAIDKYIVDNAYVAAYGHRKLANFVSDRVDFQNCTVTHPVYQLDFTQFCLK
jgi:peptide/nickel transport system substrate-binding protein